MKLEDRVRSLEREARTHRLLWGLVGMVAVGFVVWGQAGPLPETVRARSFEVVDADGRALVKVFGWKHGGIIEVYSNDESLRALLHATERIAMDEQRTRTPEGVLRLYSARRRVANISPQSASFATPRPDGTWDLQAFPPPGARGEAAASGAAERSQPAAVRAGD